MTGPARILIGIGNPYRRDDGVGPALIEALETAGLPGVRLVTADGEPAAGTGHGLSEAPRGLLYHRYRLAADGTVEAAVIIPPTSQNQAAIEADLRGVVAAHLDLDDAALTTMCERVIRNYDPCISCAAHFLDLRIERR